MAHTNIKLYGTNWCSDCKRSKKFLGEQRVHYEFIDIEENMEGQAVVRGYQKGGLSIPTIVFEDGSVLIEPSNAEIAAKLGLKTKAKCEFYDLITVGGGPTALTTAIYAARDGHDVLVIERSGLGGQAGITERLDNYPGFPEGVTGAEFAERIIEQARRYGVELLSAQNVVKVGNDDDAHFVETDTGHRYRSNAVLIATGSTYKRLGVPGEDDFIGAGVHFCATCDGPFYKGREVAVIGGGNSAVEEAAFLTRFCPKVTILVRGSELTANKIAVDKAMSSPQSPGCRYHEEQTNRGNQRITCSWRLRLHRLITKQQKVQGYCQAGRAGFYHDGHRFPDQHRRHLCRRRCAVGQHKTTGQRRWRGRGSSACHPRALEGAYRA